jgi:hypothetical protein
MSQLGRGNTIRLLFGIPRVTMTVGVGRTIENNAVAAALGRGLKKAAARARPLRIGRSFRVMERIANTPLSIVHFLWVRADFADFGRPGQASASADKKQTEQQPNTPPH